ncbi:MAG: hypothetical protein A2X94_15810 [Bdellovibrionales bacterium GWB1_55_8]|nr:MAG: hypothetical protein A2X94_15810 [Bdellovibrionales bacterium GWB1_55_8]
MGRMKIVLIHPNSSLRAGFIHALRLHDIEVQDFSSAQQAMLHLAKVPEGESLAVLVASNSASIAQELIHAAEALLSVSVNPEGTDDAESEYVR